MASSDVLARPSKITRLASNQIKERLGSIVTSFHAQRVSLDQASMPASSVSPQQTVQSVTAVQCCALDRIGLSLRQVTRRAAVWLSNEATPAPCLPASLSAGRRRHGLSRSPPLLKRLPESVCSCVSATHQLLSLSLSLSLYRPSFVSILVLASLFRLQLVRAICQSSPRKFTCRNTVTHNNLFT